MNSGGWKSRIKIPMEFHTPLNHRPSGFTGKDNILLPQAYGPDEHSRLLYSAVQTNLSTFVFKYIESGTNIRLHAEVLFL